MEEVTRGCVFQVNCIYPGKLNCLGNFLVHSLFLVLPTKEQVNCGAYSPVPSVIGQ